MVVTGGVGHRRAVCRQLAADGVPSACSTATPRVPRCRRRGGRPGPAADVAKSDELEAALGRAAAELGGLRGLVNNAGVGNLKPLTEYTDREVDLIWRVNVAGVFAGIRAAAPLLRPSGGSIVNVASVSGVRPTRGEAPYSASKAAVIALTMSAALELGPEIRVNCVSPGFVRTPLNEVIAGDDRLRAAVEAATPLGRVGAPEAPLSPRCCRAPAATCPPQPRRRRCCRSADGPVLSSCSVA